MDANNDSAEVEAVSIAPIIRMAFRQLIHSSIFIIKSSRKIPIYVFRIWFHLLILLYHFYFMLSAITSELLGIKCNMHSENSIFLFLFWLQLIRSEIVSLWHRILIVHYLSLQVVLAFVRLLFNMGVLAILKLFSHFGINFWSIPIIHNKYVYSRYTKKKTS